MVPKFGFSRICVIPREEKRARWFKSEPKDRELREETPRGAKSPAREMASSPENVIKDREAGRRTVGSTGDNERVMRDKTHNETRE